jgi:peptidyl-prolyl cis-trans isomerase B (cyclophilin B)
MIKMQTSMGDIHIKLNTAKAPETCANFLRYVEQGFYDGTIFHRVIKGFMIQGGGFTADMHQKPTGSPVKNEADNKLDNKIGTIAMARTSDPHSATAQFFINVADNDFLNHRSPTSSGWGYCVFGQVTGGMDTVQSITKSQTGNQGGHQDVPLTPIIINKVTVEADAG